MTLEITTPAVLFPTVSLLLLAYTNRFLALTAIVRQMDSSGEVEHEFYQVKNLRKRLNYIKKMQYFGVSSLLMCAISMLFLFLQMDFIGKISFGISLVSLIVSLLFSLLEIQISLEALRIHLNHNSESEEKNK
ncbi:MULTISPECIES: DUF2721 domain-containing protein [Leptotrichia]|jgi:hypothetical protein|uniref:II family cellulose-binding protein n=1 Tax=Leptotrichia wadei TaxID=157687 RepID=A0A510KVH0_9FUSO|nr:MULTISPECIES: DUF2721 domain-containing protein [Leptotrichia]NWO27902.1 DUF2721 domain-containing protein [Leptotrichia sp. oral taxon 417]BBM55616.1 hypothetical protein JMUB3936_1915 [Leptotrichia wadei]VTX72356.1 Uncharacterised protein [uncultured Leptotrichia sp.]